MSWELNLEEVIRVTKGRLLSQEATSWSGVGADTRDDLIGQLFVALRGDQFDAHDFVKQAVKKGATGLLVDKAISPFKGSIGTVTVVQVEDTLKGLQDLANFWRRKHQAKVIAITGSTGKTTTKEFTATLLKKKFKTHFSKGSYNNHWGVPLTLLGIDSTHEIAVVEMGMNHCGELTRLCEIAEPDVTLVTNVGQAHIGQLGSQQAVVDAKWEIYRSCPDSIQVYNLANEYTFAMYTEAVEKAVEKIITFSDDKPDSDVNLRVTALGLDFIQVMGFIGRVEGKSSVPVFGRQNGANTMAAAALALAVGMEPEEIWSSISELHCVWGRNQLVHLKNGTQVLFDGYNANPESMAALIKNIVEIKTKGRKIYIFGEMLELGAETGRFHRELGEMVGSTDADMVWFVGPSKADFEQGLKRSHFQKTTYLSDSYEHDLAFHIGSVLNDQDIVVIKGSRGMKLEQVLQKWDPIDF